MVWMHFSNNEQRFLQVCQKNRGGTCHLIDFNHSQLDVRLLGEGERTVDLCDMCHKPFAIASRVASLIEKLHYCYGVFFITMVHITPLVARENIAVHEL